MKFTVLELESCAWRELKQREFVYPRLIAANRMRPSKADREIALMRRIAEHFAELAKGERLQ